MTPRNSASYASAAIVLLALLALSVPARAQPALTGPKKNVQAAKEFLSTALADPNTTALALSSLQLAIEPNKVDADLTALFVAYSSHADKRVRLVASSALSQLKCEQAIAAIQERAKSDPVMAIRAQSIAVLIQWKAATPELLQEGMRNEDENIQYLSARGLVSMGQGALAADRLSKLAESKDISTAGLARLDLLTLGRSEQLDPIARLVSDPNLSPSVAGMLLERVQEDKIAAAAGIAEQLSVASPSEEVRLHAMRAVAAVSPDAGRRISEALAKTDKTATRVLLLRMLAGLKDAPAQLGALAKGDDLTAALARFELSRPAMDATTAQAAADLAAFEHPIVMEHMLACVKEDLDKTPDKADVYTPVLLDMLRKAPKATGRLRLEQEVAARSATLLGDIGSPRALAGLKEVLAGPFGEAKRAAVGGLVRSKNRAATDLVKQGDKPVLDSPYPELSATAAIALARLGDKDAARTLGDIVTHSNRYSPDLVTLVSWYTLKLADEQTSALQDLIKAAK